MEVLASIKVGFNRGDTERLLRRSLNEEATKTRATCACADGRSVYVGGRVARISNRRRRPRLENLHVVTREMSTWAIKSRSTLTMTQRVDSFCSQTKVAVCDKRGRQ